MNSVTDQQDLKKEKILDAAHERFLHYGYAKTTMNEIAGDLSMSKALLYYYFPDKSQLYIAVMRKLSNDFLKTLEEKTGSFQSLKEAFIFQVNTQHDFITNNYNFFDFFRLNEQNLPEPIWEIVNQIYNAEIKLLNNALIYQVEQGTIKYSGDSKETVELLLDALHGVRVGVMTHKKAKFPRKEDLDEIHKKKLILTDIFIDGLLGRCNVNPR